MEIQAEWATAQKRGYQATTRKKRAEERMDSLVVLGLQGRGNGKRFSAKGGGKTTSVQRIFFAAYQRKTKNSGKLIMDLASRILYNLGNHKILQESRHETLFSIPYQVKEAFDVRFDPLD
ncbi:MULTISPECIES: hypothetical protein [unclassified Nitrospina]|uniref:hypothetical protein n=1 Tax=unclassified Nitrospina TaxID=2638683 RepID=UPI003F97171A